jgi:DNA-binding transcriptional MerR regulator
MYPSLRPDHLRYLEKCGLIKPLFTNSSERFYGFADLTALRQIAGELLQGAAFRAVVRQLQSSRTGQLSFDFRLEAQPARIIEL